MIESYGDIGVRYTAFGIIYILVHREITCTGLN